MGPRGRRPGERVDEDHAAAGVDPGVGRRLLVGEAVPAAGLGLARDARSPSRRSSRGAAPRSSPRRGSSGLRRRGRRPPAAPCTVGVASGGVSIGDRCVVVLHALDLVDRPHLGREDVVAALPADDVHAVGPPRAADRPRLELHRLEAPRPQVLHRDARRAGPTAVRARRPQGDRREVAAVGAPDLPVPADLRGVLARPRRPSSPTTAVSVPSAPIGGDRSGGRRRHRRRIGSAAMGMERAGVTFASLMALGPGHRPAHGQAGRGARATRRTGRPRPPVRRPSRCWRPSGRRRRRSGSAPACWPSSSARRWSSPWPAPRCRRSTPTATSCWASASRRRWSRPAGTACPTATGRSPRPASTSRCCASASPARRSTSPATSTR